MLCIIFIVISVFITDQKMFLLLYCCYLFVQISAVKVKSALTQIHFNGTSFINARLTQRVFSVWPVARPVVGIWRNGYAQCCQLSNIADPFSDFFSLQKSTQTLFSFWESLVLPHEREVLRHSAHTTFPLSLCVSSVQRAHTSLSLSLGASARFSAWQLRCSTLSQTRYYVASVILHASIAEITAQLLPLCYVYLISSDNGSIIRIFVQINILEGRAGFFSLNGSRFSHYLIFIPLSDNRNSKKYINENYFIENLAASKLGMQR